MTLTACGQFGNFNTNKIVNDVVDSALGQKPKVNDLIISKDITKSGDPSSLANKFGPNDSKIYVFLKILNFLDKKDTLSAEWNFHDKNKCRIKWDKLI